MNAAAADMSELPDPASRYYPGDQTPGPADGLCELCGQGLLQSEPRVCARCVAANPTIASALRAEVNETAR